MSVLRLAVLASGRGSNLLAILEAIAKGELEAQVVLVISDKEGALALDHARQRGIPALFHSPRNYPDKEAFEAELARLIEMQKVDYIVLAGFMRILSPYFLSRVKTPILNIHPSLLPAFPGLQAQKQALAYGVRYTGCTVHFVDEGVDAGPILLQAVVPVYPSDTEETLSQRILKEEHKLYPQALQLLAEKRVVLEGRKVIIREEGECSDQACSN